MANGFGSMFIGVAGLQSSQNALNVTSNNLANLDTTGYVRQSVLFADRDYVTFNTTAAISNQQSGLGVTIGDVVHSRDVFLDRLYRTESSRQSFYASTSEALTEVQNYYQELEGQAFQDALTDFWGSFQELYKYPEDSVYQNLVIQKAQLFTSRSSAVYSGLKSYQYNINSQISDDIDQVNELGKTISELNLQIQKVEAGNIETAMTLRDARDLALDELSSLVDISYKEEVNGVVRVSVEGNEFVNENGYYKVEKQMTEEAMELLKVFGLEEEAETLADNLPYGKQRKLEIARALATKPKLLLLDEPAAGMNPNETLELMETIRFVREHFDMTILLIEHDMKLVGGICEELTVLNFGRVLCQGKTSDVLNNPEVIKAYLGE